MEKINIHCCTFDLNLHIQHKKRIDLFVDFCDFEKYMDNNSIKILLIVEPYLIHPEFRHLAIRNKDFFDYILTYDEEILKKCDNAILFEYGTTWIKKDYKFKDKIWGVSTIVGGKTITKAHLMRHKLWYKQNKIENIPTYFFMSSKFKGNIENINNNLLLKDNKEPLYDYQFHIAIENNKSNYYFTEKIIDCFQTKTIPIYYGCPNIDEYFDSNGIIVANSVNDIIDICNSLTIKDYKQRKESVEKNYKLSKKWINLSNRLEKKIKSIIE